MSALRRFHGDWGYIAIVFNGLAGFVALAAWRWPRLRGRWVWAATIGAEAAMMLQVVVGVILVSSHKYTAPRFHMFYGFVAFITVGIAYSYRYLWKARGRLELAYGIVGLFLVGVGIRAILQVV